MKKIFALALVLVMLCALSACGKEEAPAATEAPEVLENEEPVIEPLDPFEEAEPTPEPIPTGIEPDSGMYTVTSDFNGISFEYDSKYVAMQNPMGNISVFAGTDTEMNYVNVSLMSDTDAVSYLNDIIAATGIELEGRIVTAANAPAAVQFGENGELEAQYIYYTYTAEDTEGNIACAYYAQDLADNVVVVYSYTALEGQTADVEGIIKHAIETFSLAA